MLFPVDRADQLDAGGQRSAGRDGQRQRRHPSQVDRRGDAADVRHLPGVDQGRREPQQRRQGEQVDVVPQRGHTGPPPGRLLPRRAQLSRGERGGLAQPAEHVAADEPGRGHGQLANGRPGLGVQHSHGRGAGRAESGQLDRHHLPAGRGQRRVHRLVHSRVGVEQDPPNPSRGVRRHGEPGFEQRHPGDQPGHVARHRADRVQAGGERPYPRERDPAPRGLQAGRAAARGRNADRSAGVRAVGHVGLPAGHGHGRAAGRAARYPGGVQRVDRGAERGVDPADAVGQFMQRGLAGQARFTAADSRAQSSQARGVGRGGLGVLGHRATARGGGPSGHVDQVFDPDPQARPGRGFLDDPHRHSRQLSHCRRRTYPRPGRR